MMWVTCRVNLLELLAGAAQRPRDEVACTSHKHVAHLVEIFAMCMSALG
jgi:hypothetical protein